jgi:hypothetical protein
MRGSSGDWCGGTAVVVVPGATCDPALGAAPKRDPVRVLRG